MVRRGSSAYSGNQFSALRVVVPAIGPASVLVVRLPGLKALLPSPGEPLPHAVALPSTILLSRSARASIAAFFSSSQL